MNTTKELIQPSAPAHVIRPRCNKADIQAMRRQLIESAWLDYKLFGCMTETALAFARRIQKEKARK